MVGQRRPGGLDEYQGDYLYQNWRCFSASHSKELENANGVTTGVTSSRRLFYWELPNIMTTVSSVARYPHTGIVCGSECDGDG